MPIIEGQNTFISLADADEYFKTRIGMFGNLWASIVDDQKEAALVTATKRICRCPVKGIKADPTQALAYPRAYMTDSLPVTIAQYDKQLRPGYFVEPAIPQAVKEATCEEALALLAIGNSERLQLQQQGVTSFSLAGLSENYAAGAGKKRLLSEDAKELLTPYLAGVVRLC